MSDDRDDYVNALVGMPPLDWESKVNRALNLLTLADSAAVTTGDDAPDEDMFLIAAAAMRRVARANPLGFVQRAKQVAKWLSDQTRLVGAPGPSSREVLENKSEELARQVANGLFTDEGFILLVFHTGSDGYVAHAASVNRNDQIKLIEEHLSRMKAEQVKQS